jgi:hypothetical protein
MIGPRRKHQRNLEILEKYRSGISKTELARVYGICRDRVRQIISKYEREERKRYTVRRDI